MHLIENPSDDLSGENGKNQINIRRIRMENELVFFETKDESVKLNVKLSKDNVWLTRNQMAELFDRDVKTICWMACDDFFE